MERRPSELAARDRRATARCRLSAGAQIRPSQFADFAFHQHPGAQLPLDAVLRDESGRPVRLGSLLGRRPLVVVLEYLRCPNLCGLVLGQITAQMKQQNLQPGRDLQFVAISIDPREKPSDGACGKRRLHGPPWLQVGAGWHFLTGDPGQVKRIACAIGFPYKYDPSIDQYAHPAGFVVATPDGESRNISSASRHKPGQLRTAVEGAAGGDDPACRLPAAVPVPRLRPAAGDGAGGGPLDRPLGFDRACAGLRSR